MTQIKLRRDTSAAFASSNPILGNGEPAYETDTKKLKIGDGTTAYTQLEYFSAGGGGGGTTDISATLPLKIVDGVISLEVDGQTIQIVDGKLTATPGGSTTPENMVTIDTDQEITGSKLFSNGLKVGGYAGISDNNGETFICVDPSHNGWTIGSQNSNGWFSNVHIKRGTSGDYINIDSGNISEYVPSVDTSNLVDLTSAQTITGSKTFKGPIKVTNSEYTRTLADVNTNGGVPYLYLGDPTSRMYIQASKPINRMNSGGIEYPIIDTENISSHVDGNTITWDVSTKKLSAVGGSAPANMMTTDTTQTISGDKTLTGITTISNDIKFTIGKKITTPDGQWLMQLGTGFIGIGTSMRPLTTYDSSNYYLHNKSVIAGDGIEITEPSSGEIQISSTIGNMAAYITETYVNGTSGYRLYSDKYIEQWGYKSGTTSETITFLKAFKDTNYNVVMATEKARTYFQGNYTNKTTTSMEINYTGDSGGSAIGASWMVTGYIA